MLCCVPLFTAIATAILVDSLTPACPPAGAAQMPVHGQQDAVPRPARRTAGRAAGGCGVGWGSGLWTGQAAGLELGFWDGGVGMVLEWGVKGGGKLWVLGF